MNSNDGTAQMTLILPCLITTSNMYGILRHRDISVVSALYLGNKPRSIFLGVARESGGRVRFTAQHWRQEVWTAEEQEVINKSESCISLQKDKMLPSVQLTVIPRKKRKKITERAVCLAHD